MPDSTIGKFYAGTSGLVLPVPNKQFYPEEFKDKSRLTYYASLFNSIEINASFYKVPLASTIKNWSTQVPDDFIFTFKLWRDITHNKGLAYDPDHVKRFIEVINNIGHKKGSLLVQFPPSLKAIMLPQLEKLLFNIAEADPERTWKVALEFRHSSWYHEDVLELIDHFGSQIVIHDKPGSAPGMIESDTAFRYVRFHGPNGDYRGTYEADFLYEFAEKIQDWVAEGRTVFTYFNNTMGEAIKNLNLLNSIIIPAANDAP